ncbi:MAG: DUF1659 domain-containing protein [Clostridium sp.]
MAINTKISAQSLVLTMFLGQSASGKAVFKNVTLKNVKPEATNEAIHLVSEAVKTVLPYEVRTTSKNIITELTNDIV